MAGVAVTLTDGQPIITIPPVGAVLSHGNGSDTEYLIVNFGVPGVGIVSIQDRRVIRMWGSGPEAEGLMRQQFDVEKVSY